MAKKKRGPRVVHFEAKTAEGYRWLRQHARGAKPIYVDAAGNGGGRGAFLVTDEAAWAESLRAADAREI
jgi:biotin carboxylase